MAKLGNVYIEMSLDDKTFKASLNQAQTKARSSAKKMETSLDRVKKAGKLAAVAITGITAAFGGMMAFATRITNIGDQFAKMSKRTGVAVETLSSLKLAAELADVNMSELSVGLRQMQRNLADATLGVGEAKRAFEILGYTQRDLKKYLSDPTGILEDLAKRITSIGDSATKTQTAMYIFGRSGTQLLTVFEDIAQRGLKAVEEESRRLGTLWTGEMAAAAERFNDDLTRIKASAEGLSIAIFNKLYPSLQGAIDWFSELAGVIKKTEVQAIDAQLEKMKEAADIYRTMIKSRQAAGMVTADIEGRLQKTIIETIKLEQQRHDIVTKKQADRAKATKEAAQATAKSNELTLEEIKNWGKKLAVTEEYKNLLNEANVIAEDYANAQMAAYKETGKAFDENFIQKQKEFDQLLRQAMVIGDDYSRAYIMALEEAGDNLDSITASAKKTNDVARDLGFTFSSAFEDAILEGQKLSDVLRALAQDVLRIFAQEQLTKPLAAGITKVVTGLFHTGGIVGQGGMSRMVPAMAFAGAPRAHEGLLADEIPIIAKKGEGVFTQEQMKGMGGPPINFTTYNDFRGADPGSEARIKVEVKRSEDRIMNNVTKSILRNGTLAEAVRRAVR